MSGNFRKEDLRIIKTRKALYSAMVKLLEIRAFSKITVYDVCEEALVSRATFYMHYVDKYDLLYECMEQVKNEYSFKYLDIERSIKQIVDKFKKQLINLAQETDRELLTVISNFLIPVIHVPVQSRGYFKTEESQIPLKMFCAGGIINWFLWQAQGRFEKFDARATVQLINMIKGILENNV